MVAWQLTHSPQLVEPGHGEDLSPVRDDKERLLADPPATVVPRLPFVVPIGRQQTPLPGKRVPESGFDRDRFCARVDQLAGTRWIFGPRWHQPPPKHAQLPGHEPIAAALKNRVDRLGGRHVVVRLQRLTGMIRLHHELLQEFLALTRGCVATTHVPVPPDTCTRTRPGDAEMRHSTA